MMRLVLVLSVTVGHSRRVQTPVTADGATAYASSKAELSAQSFVEVSHTLQSSFAPAASPARLSVQRHTATPTGPRLASEQNAARVPTASMQLPEEEEKSSEAPQVDDGINRELVDLLKTMGAFTIMSYTLIAPEEAMAAAADWYPLAGRTGSLVHPIVMLLLFASSLYSGYLGLQWRNLRTIGQRIKDVQAQAPKLSDGKPAKLPVQAVITKVKGEHAAATDEADKAKFDSDLAVLQSAAVLDLDAQYTQLVDTRESLKKGNVKDTHQTIGSVLLGVGVTVAILGTFNTYMRAGKLFPGPHLYAGMGITICWAIAAAVTPAMQKGNDLARNVHIALNGINVCLFGWQLYTGFGIAMKVIEKTQWP